MLEALGGKGGVQVFDPFLEERFVERFLVRIVRKPHQHVERSVLGIRPEGIGSGAPDFHRDDVADGIVDLVHRRRMLLALVVDGHELLVERLDPNFQLLARQGHSAVDRNLPLHCLVVEAVGLGDPDRLEPTLVVVDPGWRPLGRGRGDLDIWLHDLNPLGDGRLVPYLNTRLVAGQAQ